MRLVARLLCVLLTVGCNEVTTPTTAPLLLTVMGYDVEWEKALLEGVKICETDTANCELTDANGQVMLELPIDKEVSYTFEKEGYGSYIVADVVPPDGGQRGMGMRTDEHLKMQFERVDSSYPMKSGTGRILLQVSEREFAGVTFELVNATGKPYYYDEERNWDPNLTATTSRGWGGFVEVSPGDRFRFHVIYGGTAQRCFPYVGWPGEANSVWFPVREGYTTTVDMICPPQQGGAGGTGGTGGSAGSGGVGGIGGGSGCVGGDQEQDAITCINGEAPPTDAGTIYFSAENCADAAHTVYDVTLANADGVTQIYMWVGVQNGDCQLNSNRTDIRLLCRPMASNPRTVGDNATVFDLTLQELVDTGIVDCTALEGQHYEIYSFHSADPGSTDVPPTDYGVAPFKVGVTLPE